MDKQEASRLVADKLSEIQTLLTDARAIADEAGIKFELNIGYADNVDRTIGGEYYGKGMLLDSCDYGEVTHEWGCNDHLEETDEEDRWGDPMHRLTRGAWHTWQSSSEMC